jgi:hypothetical protein
VALSVFRQLSVEEPPPLSCCGGACQLLLTCHSELSQTGGIAERKGRGLPESKIPSTPLLEQFGCPPAVQEQPQKYPAVNRRVAGSSPT